MWLFAGLGNPGRVHERHRHNIGFMAVDRIVRRYWPMGNWRTRFQGETMEFGLGGEKILALKPQTFMNLSGNSVGDAAGFYKIPPAGVVILHDDLDLEPGRIDVKRGGGHGGHNGLKSIDDRIGSDYWRIRLGLGHPASKAPVAVSREEKQQMVLGHVLGNFSREEEALVDPVLDRLAEAMPLLVQGNLDAFRRAVSPAAAAQTERSE